MELPNLIVIGGAKAGSTSLHHYLGLHPQIFMSREKEVRFFSNYFRKGEAWYKSHFRLGARFTIRGEASPQYTAFPHIGHVPERMHGLLPGAKLIYIVRDPIARLLSHYLHVTPVADGGSFRRALTPLETNPFVAGSRQGWQLEQYLPYYPLERILVLTSDELKYDRRAAMAKTFRFLGVDDKFDSPQLDVDLNVSPVARREHTPLSRRMAQLADLGLFRWIPTRVGVPLRTAGLKLFSKPASRQPLLDDALETRLQEIFAEDVGRLRQLTGLRLDSWAV